MQRKLLTSGNVFKRTDGRWNGVVWYTDEQGTKRRKSFCGGTKPEVKEKIRLHRRLQSKARGVGRVESHAAGQHGAVAADLQVSIGGARDLRPC